MSDSEDRGGRLAENAKSMTSRMSQPDAGYQDVSDVSSEVVGYSREESYSNLVFIREITHSDPPACFDNEWANPANGGTPVFFELRIAGKSGDVRRLSRRHAIVCDDLAQAIVVKAPVEEVTEPEQTGPSPSNVHDQLENEVLERNGDSNELSRKLKAEPAVRKRTEDALGKEKTFIEGTLDTLTDIIFVFDVDQRFLRWNKALRDVTGYADEEISSMKPTDFLSGGDVFKCVEAIATAVKDGHSESDASVVTKGGEHVPFEFVWDLLRDSEGSPPRICVVGRNISARKCTEKALRESEERYRAVFNNAALGINLADRDGLWIQVNEPLAKMLGYSKEELLGRSCFELTHPDDLEMSKARHEDLLQGRSESYQLQKRYLKKDGTVLWAELSVSAFYNERGDYEATIGVIADITERKQAEQALCESEEKYHSIVEYMGDAYFEVDLKGNIVFCNDSTCRAMGYTREELVGMNNRHYMDEATAKVVFNTFNRVYRTGKPATLSGWDYVRRDGTRRIVETQVALSRDAAGKPCGFRGYSRDVTERKEAEAALLESEAKYRTIIENIEEGYHEVDVDGNMVFCNDALCKILGYSRDELIGMNYRQYMDDGTAAQALSSYHSVYRTGRPVVVPGWKLITKDGRARIVDTSVSLIRNSDGKCSGFRGIVRDVTERERGRMQSLQAQKMEAIGSLAAGIAHDFNNILYAIIGFTELCLDDVPTDTELRSNLQAVLNSGYRARDLVNQILTFSRRSRQEKRVVNVVPIVKEAIKFLRASLPSTIEIRQIVDPELRPLVADPTEIHQIVMNLCTNAGHAMRETGGLLEITVEDVDEDESTARLDPELVPRLLPATDRKRHGNRYGCGDHSTELRALFHHQAEGRGHGVGFGGSPWDRK